MANGYGGNRIQNITQTLEIFEAAEQNYRDDAAVESFVLRYTRAPDKCLAIPFAVANIPHMQIKLPFKTNNSLNSTMTASFLQVIVSKKNKQAKKKMSFIEVYHKFT